MTNPPDRMLDSNPLNPGSSAGRDDHSMLEKIVAEVQRRGLTAEGADWVVKGLYPPWNRTSCMMPGEDCRPSVVFDTRNTTTLTRGVSCPADSNWDCLIVASSADGAPVFVVRGPSGCNFASEALPTNAESEVYVIENAYSLISPGLTFRTSATTLTAGCAEWPDPLPAGSRNIAKSLTVNLVASALYNGGAITVGQLAGGLVAGEAVGWDSNPLAIPVIGSYFWATSNIILPGDEATLAEMAPAVFNGPASEGFFAVNRVYPDYDGRCEGSNCRGKIAAAAGAGTLGAGLISFDACPAAGSAQGWPYMPYRAQAATSTVSSGVTLPWWGRLSTPQKLRGYPTSLIGDSDCTTTVAFIRGLSPQASIQLNYYGSLQMALHPSSAFAPMARRPPLADPQALRVYAEISARFNDAYPARFNSLALVAPAILSAVKAALPQLTKIPAVGRIAARVAPVAAAVSDLFRDEQALPPRPRKKQQPAAKRQPINKKRTTKHRK